MQDAALSNNNNNNNNNNNKVNLYTAPRSKMVTRRRGVSTQRKAWKQVSNWNVNLECIERITLKLTSNALKSSQSQRTQEST